MKKKDGKRLEQRETEILERLANTHEVRLSPMLEATNVAYEVSGRADATAWGGVASMYQLARTVGLVESLDEQVHADRIRRL